MGEDSKLLWQDTFFDICRYETHIPHALSTLSLDMYRMKEERCRVSDLTSSTMIVKCFSLHNEHGRLSQQIKLDRDRIARSFIGPVSYVAFFSCTSCKHQIDYLLHL